MDLDQSADTLDTPFPDAAVIGDADDGGHFGKLTGNRRSFIKGIAAAGASTMAAYAIDATGTAELFAQDAAAAGPNDFATFTAIAPSSADAFQVPPGYRADVVFGYGDTFANVDGTQLTYGYNNDFLAFFPLPAGSQNSSEGLLFINHEYPGPFLQHGEPDARPKTLEQIELERESVGNSVLHVKRDEAGVFRVISPSGYNRRITGRSPDCRFTGPLANDAAYPGIGASAKGSLANCSGGITPWGTALSCEENYQDYAATAGFGYGWTGPSAPSSQRARSSETGQEIAGEEGDAPAAKLDTDDYYNGDGTAASPPNPGPEFGPQLGQSNRAGQRTVAPDPATYAGPAKYGWVVETDPYDPSFQPRKHTALGRFRHENTAFRAAPNAPFVLYMGDDRNNGGVYKFVSSRRFVAGRREENLRILEEGQLFIARWLPEGRRRFAERGDVDPVTAQSGTGEWVEVTKEQLVDTQRLIRASVGGSAFDQNFATNRPETSRSPATARCGSR
jgi:secreted PhoX family phosphatase